MKYALMAACFVAGLIVGLIFERSRSKNRIAEDGEMLIDNSNVERQRITINMEQDPEDKDFYVFKVRKITNSRKQQRL